MSDHYQAMMELRGSVRNTSRDRLIGCVLELLDDPDVNTSAHLLAVIMRHTTMPSTPTREPVGENTRNEEPR